MISAMTDSDRLACSFCEQPVEGRELDFRFTWPDRLLDIPDADRSSRVRGDGDIIGAPGLGVFLRVLLPVRLTGGYEIRYGTWLALTTTSDFDRARALWHAPEYPTLVLEGVLSNAIEPWGRSVMTKARVGVRLHHEVPYVEEILDPSMSRLLTETWSRDWVLSAMPDAAWHGH